MKFIVKQSDYGWFYITPDDEDEPIFGDRNPKTKEEAEQCARAANIAYSMAKSKMTRVIKDLSWINFDKI